MPRPGVHPLGCYLLGLASGVLALSGVPVWQGCKSAVRGWTDRWMDRERERPGVQEGPWHLPHLLMEVCKSIGLAKLFNVSHTMAQVALSCL